MYAGKIVSIIIPSVQERQVKEEVILERAYHLFIS
jgi:hypothetical protein